MRPPVRKVCGGCLRSVEIPSAAADSDAASFNECPYCGGPIDSRTESHASSSIDLDKTDVGVAPFEPASDEAIDWTETWNRGTFGVIGRYQLRERLGEGGFGQVFQAFDPRLDRDVALKVLKQPNPTERVMQRFFREARAAARLDHTNIVAVHDAGFENGRCWIAYQYIGGRPLWWYSARRLIDVPTAARIVRDLADALDHAHHQGVLHRDIKPANVIMDEYGRPRLTDFGLARRADLDSSLTREGAMVGTPAYMSPEQAQGNSRNVDERSDLYSLGVIFHELIYGHRPREGDDELCSESSSSVPDARGGSSHGGGPKPPPPPASLRRICERALASSVEQRYPNARSLVEDLDRWLIRNRARTAARPSRSASALLTASLLTLVCAGLVAAFALIQASSPPPPSSPLDKESTAEPPRIETVEIEKPPPRPISLASAAGLRAPFVANPARKIYHKADSACVKLMAERNRVLIGSEAEAGRSGYRPCENCFRD